MNEPSIVEQVLEAWGANAQALPVSVGEEPDWLATLEGCRLVIEEKTKFDDPALALARNATHRAGGVHGQTTPLVHDNRLSGIVRKGVAQLMSATSVSPEDLRIIWLTGVGYDAEAKSHQLIATLYGSTRVFSLDQPGMRSCYFFRNSDFFRYGSKLDGAVSAYLSGHTVTMKLCLNPYSPNWQSLRDSPFAKRFPTGLIDPVAEDASGAAFIADTDVDRSNPSAVLSYLQEKYKIPRLMNMDMNMISASVAVPRGEL